MCVFGENLALQGGLLRSEMMENYTTVFKEKKLSLGRAQYFYAEEG